MSSVVDTPAPTVDRPTRLPRNQSGQRYREWCFTLHGDHRFDEHARGLDPSTFTYMCFQPETCPTSGRSHLQGYVCLTTVRTLNGVKDVLFPVPYRHVHLEVTKGSPAENRTYCSKVESRDLTADFAFTELGNFDDVPAERGQGARNDLHQVAAIISGGGNLYEAASFSPSHFVKYHKGLAALQSVLFARPRLPVDGVYVPPKVFWFYGSTGTGKSRLVFEETVGQDLYIKPSGGWFDGYSGQKVVLFDDFRGDWVKYAELLKLLDRYPMQVPVKGGFVQWSPEIIYITCPRRPEEIFSGIEAKDDGGIEQLTRRITEVRLFGDLPPPPPALHPMFIPL